MSAGLFGSGFGGLERAALLLQDLTENDGQAGDGCEHGAEDLGVQGILAGKLSDLIDVGHRKDFTFHEAALDLELAVHLLGELADDADGRDRVALGGGQRGGAVEHGVKLVEIALVNRKAEQSVLHNGVLNAGSTQLTAQSGILQNGDALVVHKDARRGVTDTLGEFLDDGLFLAEYFRVRQWFHLRGKFLRPKEKLPLPKDRGRHNTSIVLSSAGFTANATCCLWSAMT